ncbi:MAG TPA: VanW family protein [Chthonomonadales bacterium]|nr:VanW family protein [Chthonomonadales bacterium]
MNATCAGGGRNRAPAYAQSAGRETAVPKRAFRAAEALIWAILIMLAGGLFQQLRALPVRKDVELAGYATSLRERTWSQRHHAALAARALNGRVVAPGETFSFNHAVRSWSWDCGYVKAPVSYDGELVKAFGGGVCQTSTTLYNAALLAGMQIVERHSHVFAPHYVAPGRDAAVAQYQIDLRFRNPYSWPVRIAASSTRDRLDIRILGARNSPETVQVYERILDRTLPLRLTCIARRATIVPGRAYVRNPGATGYRVITYRVFTLHGRQVRVERLGDNSYMAMNRLVQVTAAR